MTFKQRLSISDNSRHAAAIFRCRTPGRNHFDIERRYEDKDHASGYVSSRATGVGLGCCRRHVSSPPAHSPDGIRPVDLAPTDIPGDFTRYGFRVPVMVISPFTRPHYVSHTAADHTAILKLIENRFNLPSLTVRDGTSMGMTEFFDFVNVPWRVPPTPPAQPTDGACYYDHLP